MRNLWNRARQLVQRPRSRQERLRLAVDRLPAHPYPVIADGAFGDSDADYVLRLLHRDGETAASRLGPGNPRGTGLGPYTGPLSNSSDAGPYWGNYTVTYDSVAGHGD